MWAISPSVYGAVSAACPTERRLSQPGKEHLPAALDQSSLIDLSLIVINALNFFGR
jgi:hypothetical protein